MYSLLSGVPRLFMSAGRYRPCGFRRAAYAALVFVVCCCLAATSQRVRAADALTVSLPDAVGDGTAVHVVVTSASPVKDFIFTWGKGTFVVPAFVEASVWKAQLLLPVALDAAPGVRSFSVRRGDEAESWAVRRQVQVQRVEYPVQKLTVAGRYVNLPKATLARHEAERQRVREILGRFTPEVHWRLPFKRPVPGEVSSDFGLRREFNGERRAPHRGLDLRGGEGDSVRACAAGRVMLAEEHYFSGNVVYIDHGLGVVSSYMHLSAFSVRPGDMVSAGDEVGKVGKTGRVTGPHLHFGLAVLGESIAPLPLLEGGVY
ncbi:Peptidase M23 [Nitratidesulfovibrio vulgaris RCH1]|nr:Peptidase M23 [Nitratidesulfovibrio vulgaris RCH1]